MTSSRFVSSLTVIAAVGLSIVITNGRVTGAQPAPPAQRIAAIPASAGGALPTMTVVARAGALKAPATVPTDLVAATFRNTTMGELFATIVRLNPGATIDAVLASFENEDMAAFMRLGTALGGPIGVAPSQSQQIVFDVAAGEYLALGFDEESEMPVTTTFRAMPPPVATQPPPTVGTIEMGDFFFRVPTLPAGTNTFRVTNVGQQLHHMIVGRLAPGVTLEQVFEADEMGIDPVEMGLITPVPGLAELSPGQTAYPTLTFTPGTYAMVCFITDPASGAPHVALGMVEEFSVR